MSPAGKQQRVVLVVLLVLVLAAVGTCCGYHLYLNHKINRKIEALRRAGHTVTLAQLKASYPEVPDEENTAVALAKAFAALALAKTNDLSLPWLGKAKLPPNDAPLPNEMLWAIGEFVQANEAARAAVEQAVKLKHCRFPIDEDIDYETQLPHILRMK